MRERVRFRETRNCSQRGPRTGTNDHVRAAQSAAGPVGESDLQRSGSDEPSGSPNELRSRVPVIVQIHLVHAGDHRALAITDARHSNREAVVRDAELVTAAKVRGDLRTVDDVFAGQARDVRTRSTKVLALDDGDALSVSRKRPGSNGRPRAPTEPSTNENHPRISQGFANFVGRFQSGLIADIGVAARTQTTRHTTAQLYFARGD